jgi:KUP system potassium uptake protein
LHGEAGAVQSNSRAAGSKKSPARRVESAFPVSAETPAPRAALHHTAAPRTAALALAALGVVFGDIGTSPLYAFKQCFQEGRGFDPTVPHVLGILSLCFWAIAGVVCIKYITFVLRADYEGEGGVLALLALIRPVAKGGIAPPLTWVPLLVLFGSGMLYGDGIITPAISVLSAIEGLDIATTAAHRFILPLTVAILIALFTIQRRGTGKIGAVFGPVMALWFLSIGAAGAVAIFHNPAIVAALNPYFAFRFLISNGATSILVLGAVVLCVSGVEALYADLGHFGRGPITLAWYALAFPALALNYFGQGAQLLAHPESLANPFYALFPGWTVYPAIALATAATIIASQALISGAFSLTQQAIQLGYLPRLRIVHTSRDQLGQIFIPLLNAFLAIACILVVLTFKSSDALGAAYGLAVTGTMTATSIAYFVLARTKWNWPLWKAGAVVGFFLLFDLAFLIGNLPKIVRGGWIPLVIAIGVYTITVTWYEGRRRLLAAFAKLAVPVDEFIADFNDGHAERSGRTAVFLTPTTVGIPFALRQEWVRSEIMREHIVLLTIVNERRPYVPFGKRLRIERLGPDLHRVEAHFGFMQQPKIGLILPLCEQSSELGGFEQPTYFLAAPKIVHDNRPGAMPGWQRSLYDFLIHNARPYTDTLGLPANHVIQIGVEVRV